MWFICCFWLVCFCIRHSGPRYTQEEIKERVYAYFEDTPELINVASCESGFRQWDKDGNVLLGKKDKHDMGVMQINAYYHGDQAEELGFDIETLEGNLAYAKYLYEKQGTRPWRASAKCWVKLETCNR